MKPIVLSLPLLVIFLTSPGGLGAQEESGDRMARPNVSADAAVIVTDTKGVDLKSYLARVVSFIESNWFSPVPELASSAQKSRVVIEFKILENGSVPQYRVVDSSGSEPLDHSALEAVRASAPFPPLPSEFKGDHLIIQLPFSYDLPKGDGSNKAASGESHAEAHESYSKPVPIYRRFPDYTREARRAKLEGVVSVHFTVDTEGNTSDVQVTKSLGMGLDENVVEAVHKWKFLPAMRDGLPVPAQLNTRLHFRLDSKTAQEGRTGVGGVGHGDREALFRAEG